MIANSFSHNVIDILKTFSKTEILNFEVFLNSPFFNKQKTITGLFKKIIRFYPGFNNNKFTEDLLLGYISPNKNKLTLYSALSVLLDKTREFLSIQNLRSTNILMNNALLSELKERRLIKLFEKNLKKAFDNILNANLTTQNEYFIMHQLDNIHLEFLTSAQYLVKLSELNTETGVRVSLLTNLVSSFVLKLTPLYLDYLFLAFNYTRDFRTNPAYKLFSVLDIKRLLNELKSFSDRKYIFDIYTAMFDMFSDFKLHSKYNTYKMLVVENAGRLKSFELSFHYLRLIDYCTVKHENNRKDKVIVYELTKLFDIYLKKKFYQNESSNYLSDILFRNIFLFYINNKMFDKAKYFIDTYVEALRYHERDNMKNYSFAFYYYYNGKFKESLQYLKDVEMNFFFLKYDVRNLFLKIYYELGYTESSISLIDAYRHFLSKEKTIRKSTRDIYKEFLDNYEKLVRFSTGKNMQDLGYFKKKIEGNESLYSRNWMLRKIGELEGAQKKRKTTKTFV